LCHQLCYPLCCLLPAPLSSVMIMTCCNICGGTYSRQCPTLLHTPFMSSITSPALHTLHIQVAKPLHISAVPSTAVRDFHPSAISYISKLLLVLLIIRYIYLSICCHPSFTTTNTIESVKAHSTYPLSALYLITWHHFLFPAPIPQSLSLHFTYAFIHL
jgi:CBS domain containing-hemolysin-like protein